MTHHEQDIALLQMVKGCTFGKNAPDKFVGDFTAAFLVRTLRIAIEDSASYLSKFGAFNGNRVGIVLIKAYSSQATNTSSFYAICTSSRAWMGSRAGQTIS